MAWTPQEDEILISMKERARSYDEIGARLGKSGTACSVRMARLRKEGQLVPAPRSSGYCVGPPAAPRHLAADRAAERMARYIAGGMTRSAARNQVAMEFPGVLIREPVHA